jgi:hypothetical protein
MLAVARYILPPTPYFSVVQARWSQPGRRRKALRASSATLQARAGFVQAHQRDILLHQQQHGFFNFFYFSSWVHFFGKSTSPKCFITHSHFLRCAASASWFLPFRTRGKSDQNPRTWGSALVAALGPTLFLTSKSPLQLPQCARGTQKKKWTDLGVYLINFRGTNQPPTFFFSLFFFSTFLGVYR